jgi:hypothetical protein
LSLALAIFGFCWNSRIAVRITFAASEGTIDPSASRSRRMARACN